MLNDSLPDCNELQLRYIMLPQRIIKNKFVNSHNLYLTRKYSIYKGELYYVKANLGNKH